MKEKLSVNWAVRTKKYYRKSKYAHLNHSKFLNTSIYIIRILLLSLPVLPVSYRVQHAPAV